MAVLKGMIKARNYGDSVDTMLEFDDSDCRGNWYKSTDGYTRMAYQCLLYELWDMVSIKKADVKGNKMIITLDYATPQTTDDLSISTKGLRDWMLREWDVSCYIDRVSGKTIEVSVW